MPKARKSNQTKNGGSSNQKEDRTNGDVDATEPESDERDSDKVIPFDVGTAGDSDALRETPDQHEEKATEKKRRGRASTEGQALKRVLIFLSEPDVAALKSEVGDRGMSTKVREIIKEYLTKRG